jgi:hypothetical protein
VTTDGHPQDPVTPDAQRAVDKSPTDEPIHSEASAAEEVEEAGNEENDRKGLTGAEGEELVAERLAESQDSVT